MSAPTTPTAGPVFLAIKRTASRAAETYGWGVITLCDTSTGSRFRTCGGGFDMVGTVFGSWLAATHPERLQAIASRANGVYTPGRSGIERADIPHAVALYGMTRTAGTTAVQLDGACGLESMRDIAKAIGLEVRSVYVGNRLSGFNVTTGAAPAQATAEGGAA